MVSKLHKVIVFLLLLLAFVLTEVVLYSRNTLPVHSQWINSKALAANYVMGVFKSLRKALQEA